MWNNGKKENDNVSLTKSETLNLFLLDTLGVSEQHRKILHFDPPKNSNFTTSWFMDFRKLKNLVPRIKCLSALDLVLKNMVAMGTIFKMITARHKR